MSETDLRSAVPQALLLPPGRLAVRNILLATDFSGCSGRALDYALGIGSRYESQLYLFHCVDPTAYNLLDPSAALTAIDDARRELEGLAADLRCQGPLQKIEVVVKIGDTAVTLRQTARDLDLDLIVVGAHGRTGWKKLVIGSVAEAIMDEARCPVLTVGPASDRKRIQQSRPLAILVVSDGSAGSHLAESYAFSLAHKHGSRLTRVEVAEGRAGSFLARATQYECRDLTTEIANQLQLPNESGTRGELILWVAGQTECDLIVLAVPATHKFRDRIVSTDSYQVVCGAPCPVLSVRGH